MTKCRFVGALAIAALLLAAPASAQSLGEIARKLREKKETPSAKPTRVYTNDNIPREGGLSTGDAPAAEKKSAEKDKDTEKKDEKSKAELEKEYREKAAKLRESLTYEEKKLDVLQRELNLAQVQHYSSPDQALREQTTRSEINKRQAELEQQKQAVEAAKKAIVDLEDELRRKSLPQGWAR